MKSSRQHVGVLYVSTLVRNVVMFQDEANLCRQAKVLVGVFETIIEDFRVFTPSVLSL